MKEWLRVSLPLELEEDEAEDKGEDDTMAIELTEVRLLTRRSCNPYPFNTYCQMFWLGLPTDLNC